MEVLSQGRVPYPFAAWPESEPRPWENNIKIQPQVLRGAIGPKVVIRADQSMHAVGAQTIPMQRVPMPTRRRNDRNRLQQNEISNGTSFRGDMRDDARGLDNLRRFPRDGRAYEGDAMLDESGGILRTIDDEGRLVSESGAPRRERGLMDLILGEMEANSPRSFKGVYDVLRGRYSIETRPSAPASSSLGLIG